jgi:iron complex transport system ATP-binding protein
MMTLRGVRAGYGANDVLHSLDLDLPAGTAVALLGENGAGKSTLLKVLAGLLPPRSGEVRLDGRLLPAVPRREAARRIGYLPQGFEPFFPMRALDVVLLGRMPHRGRLVAPGPSDIVASRHALEELDASALAEADLREMSGGERQRVLLARVFAGEPEVMLLDEPTASLDPRHRLIVRDAVKRRAAAGTAVLLATHELEFAASADRAVLLAKGRVLAEGSVGRTLTTPLLSELFGVVACVTPLQDGPPLISLARRVE